MGLIQAHHQGEATSLDCFKSAIPQVCCFVSLPAN